MFERALRIREHHTGPRSAPVSEALAALGIVLFDHGRFRDARGYLDRAIAVQAELGEVPPVLRRQTLAVYGLVLWRLNELEQAREVAQEAHALAEAEFGNDHPIFAMALDNLGKVELARGDLERALELNRRALQIRRTKYGARHPFTALSEYHLARVLRERADADELEEARKLCVHALEVYRQRFGADHGHVARCQAELGRVELALGEHLAAIHTLTEAHGVAMRTLGVEHYETALCLSDLAHAHLAADQPRHAIACAHDAMGTLRRGGEFDDQHPYVSGLIRLIEAAHTR
jgi:tetratricopeptide (TPR) repeat protein